MTLREAIRGLGDNPLFRLERRRQWRGGRGPLLLLGVFCCACGQTVAFVLAPALAAMAVLHDKRTRLWDDILLTRLASEEIVLAKVTAALQIPAILLAVQGALAVLTLAGSHSLSTPGGTAWQEWLRLLTVTLPALTTGAAAAVSGLVVGGLMGIRAGIHYGDTFNGVAAGILGTLAVGALTVAAGMLIVPHSIFPGGGLFRVLAPLGSAGLWGAMTLELALLALLNTLLAYLLWIACVRAVRSEGS